MTTALTITQGRRYEQLIQQLNGHPNKEEIIKLALEQAADDSSIVKTCDIKG